MNIDISKITSSQRKLAIFGVVAALLGAIWFVMVRAVFVDVGGPHYHANFALYINGEKEEFTEGIFYEEVASCGGSEDDPRSRVHLHDMIGDVVHVHDAKSTWGHLFENLGFTLGNNVMYARSTPYVDGQGGNLRFILNGTEIQTLAGRTIQSEDRLLISFGTDDTTELVQRFEQIESTAAEYNERADPSACTGSQEYSYLDRIKVVLGID